MQRIFLDRIPVDTISIEETLSKLFAVLREPRTTAFHVVTVNAQFLQIANANPQFANLLLDADLSVADGVPLVWASRLFGTPIPGRVNGTDLVVRICQQAALTSSIVYFLGGRPGAATLASKKLLQLYPHLRIAGVDCPPIGFTQDPQAVRAVSERIASAAPDFLFVALGAPLQEFWIQQHRELPVRVMIGVGGSFELIAGLTKRAPMMMQKSGLEWLWRLAVEPQRLWKRYLIGNSLFVFLILRHCVSEALRTYIRIDTSPTAGKQGK